jgi:hypothetical protein
MTLVVIDPSGSFNEGKGKTGVAIIEYDENNKFDWDTLQAFSVDAKNFTARQDYWTEIIGNILRVADKVIIEQFQVRNNNFTLGKMPETILFIGALIYSLEIMETPYVLQTPNQAKVRFKDELLLKYIPTLEKRGSHYYLNNKIINDHVRDALRHLLYFQKYNALN